MYILLKPNETSPSHNVMLIKVKSICDCIDHDKRSETRYPLHLRFKHSKFVNMTSVDDELAPHILTMRIPTPLLKTQNSNLIGNICYH